MRSPFVDSASFLSDATADGRRRSAAAIRLLVVAIAMAVAASSAVLLAI